jgi:transposase
MKNRGEDVEVLLQHDKAPAHVSRWNDPIWDAEKVHWLEWPGNSLDLNPIEHIWDELKRTINRKDPREYDKRT